MHRELFRNQLPTTSSLTTLCSKEIIYWKTLLRKQTAKFRCLRTKLIKSQVRPSTDMVVSKVMNFTLARHNELIRTSLISLTITGVFKQLIISIDKNLELKSLFCSLSQWLPWRLNRDNNRNSRNITLKMNKWGPITRLQIRIIQSLKS